MWIEVSEKAAALLMSLGRVLLKGRTHKYIRRVPKPGGGYRYYYKTSGVTRSVKDDLAEGAKFRLTHEGQEGHFEVVGRSGDTVTLRHDESGGTMRVSAADLADLLKREHADVVQAQRERTAKRLAQARKTGTPKQIARMEAEAKRFGVETLSGDQKAELARIAVNERNASGGAGMTSAARIEKHKAAATAYRRKARGLPKGTLERARALNRAQDHAKMVKELEAPARFGETHRSRLLRHERLSEQSDMLFEDDDRGAAAAATVAQATAATHDAPVGPMDKKMAAAAKKAVALKRTGRAINFVEVVNGGRMGYAGRVVDGQPHTDDRTIPMLVLTRDVSDRSMADAIDKVAASGVASVLVVDSAGDIRRVAAPPIPAKRKAANEKALAAAAELSRGAPAAQPEFKRGRNPKSFKDAHSRALAFATKDATRSNLQGAYHTDSDLKIKGAKAGGAMIATDGHRLAMIPSESDPEKRGAILNDKGDLIEATYPDWRQVVPESDRRGTTYEKVDAARMSKALDVLQRYAKDAGAPGAHGTVYYSEGGNAYLRADIGDKRLGDHGNVKILIGPTAMPEGQAVAFNMRYMQDALKGASGPVQIGVSRDLAPIDVEREDGERHIIMPMRV